MELILLESTQTTPKVIIDPENNKFEISGESRPENTAKFYGPIIVWFENYMIELETRNKNSTTLNTTSIEFKLDYFNSTSAKFILDIFFQIERMIKKGLPGEIVWYYDKRDTDMKESGEEFSKLAPGVPVRYVEF